MSAQERRGDDRRRELAMPPGGVERRGLPDRRAEQNLRLVTFRVEQDLFAVEVMRVQEVVLGQPLTEVPLVDAAIRGLMNLRGQVVPAFELRRVLGYADRRTDQLPIHFIVTHRDGPVSLLVDEQGDYLELNRSWLREPPPTLERRLAACLVGVCELPDSLLLVLDVDRAIDGTTPSDS